MKIYIRNQGEILENYSLARLRNPNSEKMGNIRKSPLFSEYFLPFLIT